MTKPLDEDLRVRVVGAVGEGLSSHASAARFRVSISSAIRWAKLRKRPVLLKPSRWAAMSYRLQITCICRRHPKIWY